MLVVSLAMTANQAMKGTGQARSRKCPLMWATHNTRRPVPAA